MARAVLRLAASLLLLLIASLATATAQFDPARVSPQAPAVAALLLEPDSRSGYVAHRLVAVDGGGRVPILRIVDAPATHVLARQPLQ
jgi:hypothetical protein